MLVGPLRYLIGADTTEGEDGCIIEVGYDQTRLPAKGLGFWKYGNLFNEKYADQGRREREYFGPYLHSSDTADEYDEGQIDPRGPGWQRNLNQQFAQATGDGFKIIELDNPDAYSARDVIAAVELAAQAGLQVVAKNPLLVEGDHISYVKHPAVVAIVVEAGAGTTDGMDWLRRAAGKPLLPVFFVAFGNGRHWIEARARVIIAKQYHNMGATYSNAGEYTNSIDIIKPRSITA